MKNTFYYKFIFFSFLIFMISCSYHQAEYKTFDQNDKKSKEVKIVKNNSEKIAEYIQNENTEKLKELFLDKMFDVNTILNTGRTPLMEAILWKKTKIVKWLLDLGADPEIKDQQGQNSYDYASDNKEILVILKPEILEQLREKLYQIILENDRFVLKDMFEEGLDFNFRFSTGETPLILAIKQKSEGLIRVFLQPGSTVDVHLVDDKNKSPLDWAEELNLGRIIMLLKRYEEKVGKT
ncbi:MAG: ankyrin repeat domain-containing protein [Bdellovibrionales bacterium]|nr:ankyrin repeat domain-containing protein [Bdellovibrionales bacterium]